MFVLTIWALLMEDFRVAALDKENDQWIACVNLCVMILFFMEAAIRCYVQRAYFNSFFFWLDIVATLTLIPDWIQAFLPNDDSGSGDGGGGAGSEQLQLARVGRSARVGTRIGRLLRLLRVLRVLKLFMAARKKKLDGKEETVAVEAKDYPPSELGKMLKNKVSHKVIAFVMLLIIGVEVLSGTATDISAEIGIAQLYWAAPPYLPAAPAIEAEPYRSMVLQYGQLFNNPYDDSKSCSSPIACGEGVDTRDNLLRLNIRDQVFYDIPILNDAYPDCTLGNFFAHVKEEIGCPSCDHLGQLRAMCPAHIARLRANELEAIVPFERIKTEEVFLSSTQQTDWNSCTSSQKEVGSDDYDASCTQMPLNASAWISKETFQQGTAILGICQTVYISFLLGIMAFLFSRDMDNLVIRPIESMVDSVTQLAANPAHKLEAVKTVKYETDALRVSLNKIAQLLQVGFGEAGNNLVAENLRKGDTVDPMVPGKKLLGAYGFCIIDDYEEVLDCLNEEILPFTNLAAQVVHDAVTRNGGQPNRNLGDAFLCVWKPQLDQDGTYSTSDLVRAETKMCDGALTAFRRCVREISKSPKLQAYNKNEEIVKYFDGSYHTKIGYGLNYGYAIEGAVGTNIKIDCSYLSPNVNLAARLESATKMYGCNILMSQYFYDHLSAPVKRGLRRVDVVCLKGSSIPMAIYTCDRSNALYLEQTAIDKYGADKVVQEFHRIFEEGMDCFVKGDWEAGKDCFDTCLQICPRDKPARRLLMHMDTAENCPDYGLAEMPYVAPEGWPGYHFLLSK